MSVEDEIRDALQASFAPEMLEIMNESAMHAGHAGHDGSGESHFRLRLRASALDAMPRLARHRAVHAALGPALMGRIHALAIEML